VNEEEAITKWCPFSRIGDYQKATNRTTEGFPKLGSGNRCACWIVSNNDHSKGSCGLTRSPN